MIAKRIGLLHFAGWVAPIIVPIEAVVVFEFEAADSARDLFAAAARERLVIGRGIAPAPEAQFGGVRLSGDEVTDLAEVALARAFWGIVVSAEVEVVGFDIAEHPVHAEKFQIFS